MIRLILNDIVLWFVGCVKNEHERNFTALVLPMTLFPSPFPKQLFNHAKVIQEALNELYFRVSLDHGFLMNALRVSHIADEYH